MWRTWPILSAKIVAQKPGDSVIPPLSPEQADAPGLPAVACARAVEPLAISAAMADADARRAVAVRVPLRLRHSGFGTPGLSDPLLAMAMLHMTGCLGLTRRLAWLSGFGAGIAGPGVNEALSRADAPSRKIDRTTGRMRPRTSSPRYIPKDTAELRQRCGAGIAMSWSRSARRVRDDGIAMRGCVPP